MFKNFSFFQEHWDRCLCQTRELFVKENSPEKFFTPFYVIKGTGREKDKRVNAKGPFHRAYLTTREWLKYFGLLLHQKPIKFKLTDGRKS